MQVLLFAVALIAVSAFATTVSAQDGQGVRHVLRGSLNIEGDGSSNEERKIRADLGVRLLISDHAPDADFFGLVTAEFIGLESGLDGQSEKVIWEMLKCHRSRGLPKITVQGIDGTVFKGGQKITVAAIPRHIGKLVPEDELMVTKPTSRSFSNLITEIAIQVRTKLNGISLNLRLTAVPCRL